MNGSEVQSGFIILSLLIFAIPGKFRYYYTLLLLCSAVILSSDWSLNVLSGITQALRTDTLSSPGSFYMVPDHISAFFILVINITVLVGFLYARGYLRPYLGNENTLRLSIHYFSYLWLYFSMILVVVVRDGLSFLIAWELMALASFFLVIFNAEERETLKTGISYLIQMHVGMFFILAGFLLVEKATGRMSFDALNEYFSNHSNLLLFLLFFTGFGIKAGFIPLHSWLPQAHPAAPSHVSGVMSGVMIKMGIYGIIRVLMSVQSEMVVIGIILLVVSLASGLFGVMMAIMQHDLKRLLAYHSIENIGIIGIGLGIGVIGKATGNTMLSLLGFSGGILHILNHSLFKSLLFFSAGSVYQAAHTRNVELLGGLMKQMPFTAIFFLAGSIAICGLPPFNGFVSEYLIYSGMFKSLPSSGLLFSIMIMLSITGLVLIGGLAVFCFTKAFGIVFLGQARSDKASAAVEVSRSMILPQVFTLVLIMLIGLVPVLFVKPVFNIVSSSLLIKADDFPVQFYPANLVKISIASGIFVLITVVLLLWRNIHLKRVVVSSGPTWGCGYTAVSSKQQYTATSYTYNYNHLASPVLRTRKYMEELGEDELFPRNRTFESHSSDVFRKYLIDKPSESLSALLKRLAVMQTGEIRHYILYAFVFILLVTLLAYFKII